jgi:hypothetical protein
VFPRFVFGGAIAFFLLAACGAESSSDRGDGDDGRAGSNSGGTGGDAAGRSGVGGSVGGAGEGGSSMGGVAAVSGTGAGGMDAPVGGTGPCRPWPTATNDAACPSPGIVSTPWYVSPCTPELSCEFLVPWGDPCFFPPMLHRFECCEWGFAEGACPWLPEGQDPRCVMPVFSGAACDVEGLTCEVVTIGVGEPVAHTCCAGRYRIGSSC